MAAWLFAAMFKAEAAAIRDLLLARQDISPLLDLGSAGARLRTEVKPHIEGLFAPLRAAGVEVIHADLRGGPGVDLVGDILDPEFAARLRHMGFRCVLLPNLLEHVHSPPAVAAACEDIVGPSGLILASVPSDFPYHADPIDTLYRPAPAELAALFARSTPLYAAEIVGETYRERLRARGASVPGELARTVLWCLAFPIRPKSARARLARWRWYRRPYRVSIALVVVTGAPARSAS